jgi:hypothetical protein
MKSTKKLTEAQCRRKEEGVRIRTGHESRMHALTAIACKRHEINMHA